MLHSEGGRVAVFWVAKQLTQRSMAPSGRVKVLQFQHDDSNTAPHQRKDTQYKWC